MKNVLKFLGIGVLFFSMNANAQELKFGTNATYPPFDFIGENNEISGFDIDLVKELGKRLDFTPKFINMNFDGLIFALKAGKVDAVIAAMSATPQREKSVDFTIPYYKTENIYIKAKNNTTLNTKEDLKGKKVGAQQGTIQEQAAKDAGAKVMPVKDIVASMMALMNNKIDAIVLDTSIGYNFVNKNDYLVKMFTEPDGSNGFSIAFDKGKYNDLLIKINSEIENMKKDGSYDKLLEKYNLK